LRQDRDAMMPVITLTDQPYAPGFYEKRGYRTFGKIDGDPGISRIFMVKDL
jgi:hypothetical protein